MPKADRYKTDRNGDPVKKPKPRARPISAARAEELLMIFEARRDAYDEGSVLWGQYHATIGVIVAMQDNTALDRLAGGRNAG